MKRVHAPRKVLVESSVAEGILTTSLRINLPRSSFEIVDRVHESSHHDPDVLEVVDFKGRFLKSCPGTRYYHCCGYKILHFGTQCSLDCSYCILQAYFNQPNLRLFGNVDQMLLELSDFLAQDEGCRLHRIGTGEFTDSLLLDPFTKLSSLLVPYFARTPGAVLELKTKTDFVENLCELDHKGHTIVAWSLNSEEISRREEPLAATIAERLYAARLCSDNGYFLAFHFDPIIEYPGWKTGYARTLDRVFTEIDPSRIVWISLGAFRFMPDLKAALRFRHPSSRIICGEFIRGLDGKVRYFRDIRAELYSFMSERIRQVDPDICVYLCMENDDIWKEALGFSPEQKGGLSRMLDKAVEKRMNIGPF
jgi:spore photoproduct lyase